MRVAGSNPVFRSGILIASLLLFGAACTERGAASPQLAATTYVAAAQRGDVAALIALAPDTYDARSEAEAKIAAYRSIRDRAVEITYRPNDITPNWLTADIVASEPAFRDSVHLQRIGSRWYVLLGRSKVSPPAAPTAQASR